MVRTKYRVESIRSSTGLSSYYLVKDIRVRDKKAKVSQYIGKEEPGPDELDRLRRRFASKIEIDAVNKKAEMSATLYRTDLIGPQAALETIRELERIKHLHRAFVSAMTASEIANYQENLEFQYVNGTTSIEGNTLTLQQTVDLLKEGFVPENKSLREINEVQNYRQVKRYRDQYKGKVTLQFIRHLHSLIMYNIDHESAGSFRRTDSVCISGCDLQASPAIMIVNELEDAMSAYYERVDDGHHPFIEAAMLHYRFEMIHPFTDGNGRVGREVFNILLDSEGFPRMLFLGRDRMRYLGCLRAGNQGRYGDMVLGFVGLLVDQRVKVIEDNFSKVVSPP